MNKLTFDCDTCHSAGFVNYLDTRSGVIYCSCARGHDIKVEHHHLLDFIQQLSDDIRDLKDDVRKLKE